MTRTALVCPNRPDRGSATRVLRAVPFKAASAMRALGDRNAIAPQSSQRCEQCGREGTRGFTVIPGVTLDHLPGAPTIPPIIVCANKPACRGRWPKRQFDDGA